jgi:hypothetical protein
VTNQISIIDFLLKIILGTPTWVWAILGYLMFVGILATKERITYIPKLFIIPLVLTILKYKIFINGTILIWSCYLFCLLLSMHLSLRATQKQKIEIIQESFSVKLPGSYITIIILLSFFVIKYFFGFLQATNYSLYNQLMIAEICTSAVFTGYFLGKANCYLNCYLKKSRSDT